MVPLAARLRERARALGLADAEVARRAGLSERRYGNYVRGVREPDFATLLRICAVLGQTPNELFGIEIASGNSRPLIDRLIASASQLSDTDLKLAIEQVEALVAHRRQ
jgi:transcriptional regulator with XRE-family HTH domain